MDQAFLSHLPQKWSEAQRRAETYLRALRRAFGPAERQLVARALTAAHERHYECAGTHPVTLVMEALFGLLPPAPETVAPVAMAPPIRRATMLPEPTEFPVHNWLRRLFCRRIFVFAGAQ